MTAPIVNISSDLTFITNEQGKPLVDSVDDGDQRCSSLLGDRGVPSFWSFVTVACVRMTPFDVVGIRSVPVLVRGPIGSFAPIIERTGRLG